MEDRCCGIECVDDRNCSRINAQSCEKECAVHERMGKQVEASEGVFACAVAHGESQCSDDEAKKGGESPCVTVEPFDEFELWRRLPLGCLRRWRSSVVSRECWP